MVTPPFPYLINDKSLRRVILNKCGKKSDSIFMTSYLLPLFLFFWCSTSHSFFGAVNLSSNEVKEALDSTSHSFSGVIKPEIVIAQNHQKPAKNHIAQRRQRRQKSKHKENYYTACQGKNIGQLDSNHRDKLQQTKTEATALCATNCSNGALGASFARLDDGISKAYSDQESSLAEVVSAINTRSGQMSRRKQKEDVVQQDFTEKLKKRVIGQIQAKIAQTQALRACMTGNENKLLAKGVTKETIHKFNCQKRKKELSHSIKNRWLDMRINLALTSVPADQVVTGKPNLSYPLSHEVSDFGSLSKLTTEEQNIAKQKWAKHLSQVPLDKVSPGQFQLKFMEENGSFLGKNLSLSDVQNLRKATESMRQESQNNYRKMIEELPLLAYLKTGDPENKQDMNQAFAKVEKNLNHLLKKVNREEVDMGLLLSFKPLVEELISESEGGYCLTAQKATIKAEKEQSKKNLSLVALGVLATLPCFMGGPVSTAVCLGTGVGMGALGYNQATEAVHESLGKALTGRDFEKITDLVNTDNARFWEIALLPTAVRGTVMGTVKLSQQVLNKVKPSRKAITNTKNQVGTTGASSADLSLQEIKQYIKKHTGRLQSQYKQVLNSKSFEEQSVIMNAIVRWEAKGISHTNISYRVKTALQQCAVP